MVTLPCVRQRNKGQNLRVLGSLGSAIVHLELEKHLAVQVVSQSVLFVVYMDEVYLSSLVFLRLCSGDPEM